MININIDKVPDADVIARRISEVLSVGTIEMDMVTKILSDWGDEWIEIIAEHKTGMSQNTDKDDRRSNSARLRNRMDKLGGITPGIMQIDNPGF